MRDRSYSDKFGFRYSLMNHGLTDRDLMKQDLVDLGVLIQFSSIYFGFQYQCPYSISTYTDSWSDALTCEQLWMKNGSNKCKASVLEEFDVDCL